MSFKSGKSYNNHKHADDLSLTYSYKEDDVFVDCGTYTYQQGNFRNYFLSAKAHNGLLIDGKSYNFLSKEFDKVSMLFYDNNDDYIYVVGKNDLYDKVCITRHLIITKEKAIIIYDEVTSDFIDFDYEITQNFNFHPDFNDSPIEVNDGTLKITHPNSKRNLLIK